MYSSDDEEVEDEEHGSSTPYAVIALCLFLLSWQSSFRVPDTCIGALRAFMHHFLLFVSTVTHSEQLSMIAQSVYQRPLSSSGQLQVSMLTPSQNLLCAHSATQFMIQMHVYLPREVEKR